MLAMHTQLLLGTVMIIATVCFHIGGLVGLITMLNRLAPMLPRSHRKLDTIFLMVVAVLGIIAIHTVEAWTWAALYMLLGEFSELERALYFSVVTQTTLGYGDITLSRDWQLLGTFESMGGLILFGASTAYLIGLVRHLFEEMPSPLKWR